MHSIPKDSPISPAAGWIQIFSNMFSFDNFPFATLLSATPPAKSRFLYCVNFFAVLANI